MPQDHTDDLFAFLAELAPADAARCLAPEEDLVVAAVLMHLAPAARARILAQLDRTRHEPIREGMRAARGASREMLARVAAVLKKRVGTRMLRLKDVENAERRTRGDGNGTHPAGRSGRPRSATSRSYGFDSDDSSREAGTGEPAPRPWSPRRMGRRPVANAPAGPGTPPRAAPPGRVDGGGAPPHAAPGSAGRAPRPEGRRASAMRDALRSIENRSDEKPPAPAPPTAAGAGGRRRAASGARSAGGAQNAKPIDGMGIAAAILRHGSADLRKLVEAEEPDLYRQLRQRMFAFDDLVHSGDDALARVFTRVETADAATALRFGPPDLQERALGAVSSRRAALISEEMELARGARIRVRDIEDAQQRVIDTALAMQAAGEILIDPNDLDVV